MLFSGTDCSGQAGEEKCFNNVLRFSYLWQSWVAKKLAIEVSAREKRNKQHMRH